MHPSCAELRSLPGFNQTWNRDCCCVLLPQNISSKVWHCSESEVSKSSPNFNFLTSKLKISIKYSQVVCWSCFICEEKTLTWRNTRIIKYKKTGYFKAYRTATPVPFNLSVSRPGSLPIADRWHRLAVKVKVCW